MIAFPRLEFDVGVAAQACLGDNTLAPFTGKLEALLPCLLRKVFALGQNGTMIGIGRPLCGVKIASSTLQAAMNSCHYGVVIHRTIPLDNLN